MKRSKCILIAEEIRKTIERLHLQMKDRFPESNLANICRESHEISKETPQTVHWTARPDYLRRFGTCGLILTTGLTSKIWQKIMMLPSQKSADPAPGPPRLTRLCWRLDTHQLSRRPIPVRRFRRFTRPGPRPEPRLPRAKPAKSARKNKTRTALHLAVFVSL